MTQKKHEFKFLSDLVYGEFPYSRYVKANVVNEFTRSDAKIYILEQEI